MRKCSFALVVLDVDKLLCYRNLLPKSLGLCGFIIFINLVRRINVVCRNRLQQKYTFSFPRTKQLNEGEYTQKLELFFS